MLNQLRSDTRLFLVHCRKNAMQNGLASALEELKTSPKNLPALDIAAIDLLEAELFYLNSQNSDATRVFDTRLIPILKQLPKEIQITIIHNKNIASFGLLTSDPALDFYYLYDYRKLSGVNPWNSSNLLIAHDEVEEGKHYDALCIYWQHLLSTYNLGIWNVHANACAILCKEFVALNWIPSASYYAILSLDEKLAKIICRNLINSKNINTIEQSLEMILATSRLLKHASVATKIIEGIQDEIPDKFISRILDYLLGICSIQVENPLEIRNIINAWDAIKSIAHRLSAARACQLQDMIIAHKWFGSVNTNRKHLIDILTNLVPVLPKSKLINLAKTVLPLAKEKKFDYDYISTVNLMCHIAYKDPHKAKTYLKNELYASGKQVDSVLGQVIKQFDAKIKIVPEDIVKIVSENMLLQVQRLKPEEEPQKVFDSYGAVTKFNKDNREKIVVQMAANSLLQTLTANKESFTSEHIEQLLKSCTRMIEEPDNSLSNKMGLINSIIGLADKLTKKQKQNIFKVLEPLASGLVIEGSVMMSQEEATNPLNPIKMNDTKPEVVAGAALYALACLGTFDPKHYGDKLNNIIEKALTDKNAIIRKHGYLAVREIPKLSDRLLMSTLYGTRDADYHTAQAAFAVILNRSDINLSLVHWRLLFLALYEAANSEHRRLRRIAAIILKKFVTKAPIEYKTRIKALSKMLKSDICHSVRNARLEA